jgi:hypothetical protein
MQESAARPASRGISSLTIMQQNLPTKRENARPPSPGLARRST